MDSQDIAVCHGYFTLFFFKKHHKEFQQECFLNLGQYLTEFCTHIDGVTPLNCYWRQELTAGLK